MSQSKRKKHRIVLGEGYPSAIYKGIQLWSSPSSYDFDKGEHIKKHLVVDLKAEQFNYGQRIRLVAEIIGTKKPSSGSGK